MSATPFNKQVRYQDPNDSRIVTTLETATGEEPIYVKEETQVGKAKLERVGVESQQLPFRLDELTREFYMFSLAPVYLCALLDRKLMRPKLNLIYQFGVELKMDRIPRVVSYKAPVPLFHGGMGDWDYSLEGLPRDLMYLFSGYVTQLVLIDREVSPIQYWRVNKRTVTIFTPLAVAAPAEVDIFLPSGLDGRLDVVENVDGTWSYVRLPAEKSVVEEASRYFERMNLA